MSNQTMDEKPNTIIIGTRESKLAMWQAKYAHKRLSESTPKSIATFAIQGMTTKGDKDQNTSLSKFSDKGIFTKELDIALLENKIDCAVHCVKDLPTTFHKDLGIACYLSRGAKNDVVLIDKIRHPLAQSIQDLPADAVIGTGSLRRQSLLKSFGFQNNISVQGIRGNLNTRLRKLVSDHLYDAIILAQIGVERLGWMMDDNAASNTDDDDVDPNALKINVFPLCMYAFPYAIGQGGLAVMCRQKDIDERNRIYDILNTLNNFHCEMCCEMERNLLRVLEGGCKVPIAARSDVLIRCKYCNLWNSIERHQCQACFKEVVKRSDGGQVELKCHLYGLVMNQDGNIKIKSSEGRIITVNNYDLLKLNSRVHAQYSEILEINRDIGQYVAHKLKEQGAQPIIDQIKEDALKERNSKNT
eukprot:220613_1